MCILFQPYSRVRPIMMPELFALRHILLPMDFPR
jgi:hypothetical protein